METSNDWEYCTCEHHRSEHIGNLGHCCHLGEYEASGSGDIVQWECDCDDFEPQADPPNPDETIERMYSVAEYYESQIGEA